MTELAKVREWTCPEHNYEQRHECTCEYCEREWDCESCATAEWVDVLNEDGTQKMREIDPFEQLFLNEMRRQLETSSVLLELLSKPFPVEVQPLINFGESPKVDE